MKYSKIELPAPKINRHLKLLLFLETVLLLVSYIFITHSYHQVESQKTEKSIRQMNYSLLTTIQYSINSLDLLSKSPITNDAYSTGLTLWGYLTSPSRIEKDPSKFETIFLDKYSQLNLLFPNLNGLFLFDPSGKVLTYKYNNTYYYFPDHLPKNFRQEIAEQKNGSLAYFTQEEIKNLGYDVNTPVLFAGRQLNNLTASSPVVMILVGVDISDISLTFEKYKMFPSQGFACFDSNGKLLFSSQDLTSLSWKEVKRSQKDSDSDIYYQIVSDTEHNLYSVIATDRKNLTRTFSVMRLVFFLFLPAILMLNLLLSVHIIRSVITSYRKMTEKVYLQSITEKDLNIQMLRSQINPHFLYNTLDSMRMASLNSGYQHLASMCEFLAKILRYGVSDSDNLVTVKTESEHLNEYIQLIRLRYPNIEIRAYLDPSIMEYKIIKLLLQPLVENSVTHGLEEDNSNGLIQIWGYQKDNTLIFTVTDNGHGISAEQLQLLRDYLNDKNSAFKSIGLKNIKKRIQLYYGEQYDLNIDSRLYQGTSVTVTLPVIDAS